MNRNRCKLCRNLADMSYEVDASKPMPLCGECMGKYEPDELNRRLGVVPEHEKEASRDPRPKAE